MHLSPAVNNFKLLLFATPWWSNSTLRVRVCVCVFDGGPLWTLSSNACEEEATRVALLVQAAETGHCWKAPCWELPEASVAPGTKDRSESTELMH